jgi:hypothetical protein
MQPFHCGQLITSLLIHTSYFNIFFANSLQKDYSQELQQRLLAASLLALDVGVGSVAAVRYVGDKKEDHSRSTESVLGRGSLVLSAILLEASVLRGLVGLASASAAGLSALGALDVGVGSVGSAEAVLGRETLVGLAVLSETVVLGLALHLGWGEGGKKIGSRQAS